MDTEELTPRIVDSLEKDMQAKFTAIPNACETLRQLMEQYSGVINDLLSAKRQYLATVRKYSDAMKPSVNPVLFTGIVAPTPMYSSSEMRIDSQQLIDLGELVEDLENQKQLAYSQLRQTLKILVEAITRTTSTADQLDVFLNQAIQMSGNGVYGSASMLSATKER